MLINALIEIYENYAEFEENGDEASKEKKPKSSIDLNLQDKLKLDFSKLNQSYKKPSKEVMQPNHQSNPQNISKQPVESNLQDITSNIEGEKQDQVDEKAVGFHQEFMSHVNEFSASWREAALKERVLP